MNCLDVGVFKKMKKLNLSDDMIARLFGDLVLAAGDTVRMN